MTSAKQPAGADEVDLLAAAVRAVPGVAALHPGMFGEVGTYLPGRRVPGIRTVGDVTEVHVSIVFDASVRDTAVRVRSAVSALTGGTVDVTVEDVVPGSTAEPVDSGPARERP